ncbi:MAG TPA: DUF2939 domain-containing protein [Ideonella sp.]|uniref:DUF2939 domain-containing protein n=1 Tax=Ideonella sp. TaxID=1929293 RepID=UPI002C5AD1B9|nr:DUF2939 domain-containing protein [Ideonella sp.]HSI51353.1 DUF2939 domain-containing protein [Ideonella sp.]
MKTRTWAALALVFAAGLAVYWYESPWLTLWQMQSAAKSGDAASFNAHVDYPRLRESLKGQVSTLLADQMGGSDGNNVGSAIGGLLGMFVADKAIDAFVRPETVMRAMQDGRLLPSLHHHKPSASSPDGTPPPPAGERLQWQTEREGADRFVAFALKPGTPREQATAFVLARHGFADWRLSELRLPQLAR